VDEVKDWKQIILNIIENVNVIQINTSCPKCEMRFVNELLIIYLITIMTF